VDIIKVDKEQNVLIAKPRWDGMGNHPVRSAADHSLRWMVRAREEEEGKEGWRSARRGLTRGSTARGATGPRQEGEMVLRVEAIPFRRVSKCPKEVERRDSEGYLETSLGVRRRMPWIKPFVRALTKVEKREGEPKARCQ
jgi:hypothetical protein